jgi:hypothetical protein
MVSGVHGAHGMSVQFSVGVDTEYAEENVTPLPHKMEVRTARVASWTMNRVTPMPVLIRNVCLLGHPGWQLISQLQLLGTQRDGSDSLAEPLWPTLPSLNSLRQRRRKDCVIMMETVFAQVTDIYKFVTLSIFFVFSVILYYCTNIIYLFIFLFFPLLLLKEHKAFNIALPSEAPVSVSWIH